MFARASWPFGSIQIDTDKIIFKGFPFTNETITKSSLKKIGKSTFFNGFTFDYVKEGEGRNIKFSPISKLDVIDALEKSGYVLS